MTPSQEMRRAVKAKDWAWATEIAMDRMRGAHGRNWLGKIERLRASAQRDEVNPFTTPLDDPRIQRMIADTASVWER